MDPRTVIAENTAVAALAEREKLLLEDDASELGPRYQLAAGSRS